MPRTGIYLLFFFSGIAGLVYQVVWVRQFGNIFGNTIYSASLVTAVFMFGLGIGSYVAGLWGDKKYRVDPRWLLRAYGYFEVGIAALGLTIAFLLPRVEPLSAVISTYVAGDNGWSSLSGASYFYRYLIAVVGLLPITFLMGGTLSLLIRHLVRSDLTVTSVRVGALYGVNTAGAAVGAFLVDFSFIPSLGILATQSVAVLINLVVGLVALRWAARLSPGEASASDVDDAPASETPTAPDAPAPEPEPPGHQRLVLPLNATALFLSGFAAMGLEIIWFRCLRILMGGHRTTFSLLLTVILLAIWLGSTAGGVVHRRLGNAARLFIFTQCAFVLSTLAIFYFLDYRAFMVALPPDQVGYPDFAQRLHEVWTQVRSIALVVALPAFLMGFSYPLANASVQRAEDSVGRKAGILYLANTLGALAGPLTAGFVLLPALGVQRSLLVLAGCGLAVVFPLWLSLALVARAKGAARPYARPMTYLGGITLALAAGMVVLWLQQPWFYLPQRILPRKSATSRMAAFSEGVNETLAVVDFPRTRTRRLVTNGHSMSGTTYNVQRYMRAFVHVPMLQMEAPRSVLVICFGVGNTLHAASLHTTVKRLELAELSPNVLRHATYFERWNRGVLRDPRLSVFINDGRQHLRMQADGAYDLITLEPPPIMFAGVASLYSVEFYRLAKKKLREGGHLTQWLPVYQVHQRNAAAIVHAFIEAFPEAVLISGHREELILMGRKGGRPTFDPGHVARRLRQQPAVQRDLDRIDMGTLTELAGSFAGGGAELRRTARLSLPVTDDLPLMEYGPVIYRNTIIPASLFSPLKIKWWCPGCVGKGARLPALFDLPAYLAVMEAYYHSEGFLRSTGQNRPVRGLNIAGEREAIQRAYANSGYLRRLLGGAR